MPSAYVTGATGFVGLNLVKRLCEEGWEVRALHRSSSDLTFLSRFPAERVVGDVTDRASLEQTMPYEVDVVFHLAASVNFWSRNNPQQTKINVEGTRNVVEVALAKKAKRFVQTSSVVAFGPQDGDVLNEESPSRADGHWINYFRTKYLADQEVAAGMGRGLNAVFVVPGYVVGPYELSHFSLMFKMLKQGKLPGAFPGAGPWCHVDTVVDALIKAAEVGTPGERFLIGAAHAKIADVLGTVADRLGVKAPKPFPAWFLKPVAKMAEWGSFITGKEPEITPEVAHMFCMDVTFDCTKAETQLGCYETSIEKMVDDMHAWLLAEGRL